MRVYHYQLYEVVFNTVAVPGNDRKSKKTAGLEFPNQAGSQPVSTSPNHLPHYGAGYQNQNAFPI